jgi:hypothetical protein
MLRHPRYEINSLPSVYPPVHAQAGFQHYAKRLVQKPTESVS